MTSRLAFDAAGRVEDPVLVLATKGSKKLGVLNTVDNFDYHKVLNGADEISFDVYKTKDGTVCPLWSNIIDFKSVWYESVDEWFEIYVSLDEDDATVRHITGTAICEAELSQINLYDVEINTEKDIEREAYTTPTIFYDPLNAGASLLHRMLDKAPHYTIEHVDESLVAIQRSFSFDDKTIYDGFQEVAEEIGCLFVFNSNTIGGKIARGIRVYDLEQCCKDCGTRFTDGDVCPNCGSSNILDGYGEDTGIIISKENLADTISFSTDTGSVKNCFRLEGGDDLMTAAIRSCNPNGSSYIWYITDELKQDMSTELVEKIAEYDALYKEYQIAHDFTVDSATYNSLVDKYISSHSILEHVYSGSGTKPSDGIWLTNFPALINAYYNAYDFLSYLQTSMMPTVDLTIPSAEEQCSDIAQNVKSVAILNLSRTTSASTIESAVKSISKIYTHTGAYNVSVKTTSWDNPTWTGVVTLTSWADETDTASTGTMSVLATSDVESYATQLIDKKLTGTKNDQYDIVTLFKSDLSTFSINLGYYSADCLQSFRECCQTCIDVLIEQGIGDADSSLYYSMYVPWREKLSAIDNELSVRENEISGIERFLNNVEAQISSVHSSLNFEDYLGTTLWNEFIAYRREDTYRNDNYISDGLTNSELIENAKNFVDVATKEIYQSATRQHSISATLADLMVMPEFEHIVDKFAVGNWIRVIVDDVPYKLRLTEYEIAFNKLQNIDVVFSDVVKTNSGVSDIKSILDSAESMASSYGAVARQATYGDAANNTLKNWVNKGLDATNAKILSNADNQEMAFDSHGLLMRRWDDITESYHGDQIKLINSALAFTGDAWDTVGVAVGRIVGPNGDLIQGIIGKYIIGEVVTSEKLIIKSPVDENGESDFVVDGSGVHIKINGTSLDDQLTSLGTNVSAVAGAIEAKVWQGDIDSAAASIKITTDGIASEVSQIKKDAITSTITEYCQHTSPTELPEDCTWQDTPPVWENGKYIWSRTHIIKGDGTESFSDPVCITGNTGADGTSGVGVDNVDVQYCKSDSATELSGEEEWSSTNPGWEDGKYIWSKTIISYSNGDSEETTPVCISGASGTDGIGVSNIIEEYYLSNSATETSGGSWSAEYPGWENGKYIWTRSKITYSSGDVVTTNEICVSGSHGSDGPGVKSLTAYYKLGTSASESPSDPSTEETLTWVTEPPAVTDTTYLWVAYLTEYDSGATSWTAPYCATDSVTREEINSVKTSIEQLPNKIALTVSNGSIGNSATIGMTIDGVEIATTGTIDLTGAVTFTDLSTAGSTKINGANITTGTISANRLDIDAIFARSITLTNSFQVNNSVWKLVQDTTGMSLQTKSTLTDSSSETATSSPVASLTIDTSGFSLGTCGQDGKGLTWGGLNISYDGFKMYCGGTSNGTSITGNDTGLYLTPAQTGELYLDTSSNMVHIGSSTIGGTAKPIYLSGGILTACSSTVGGTYQPVYMSSGTLTACTSPSVLTGSAITSSLSAGNWTNVMSISLSAGTYIITGEVRIYNEGYSFTTSIITGIDDGYPNRNSTYCSDSKLYSSESTTIVKVTSTTTYYLRVYTPVAATVSYKYLRAIRLYG